MVHLIEFIGRFHPLLVHLPIGILLLTVVFIWLKLLRKLHISDELINILLGVGSFTAVLSCLTGFLLSQNGEHDASAVQLHQWMGIGLAVVATTTWISFRRGTWRRETLKVGSFMLFLLIMTTSHLGGSLTHGSSYLIEPLSSMGEQEARPADLSQLKAEEAQLYNDIVRPILKANCYTCHSEQKQKGKLRLDQPELILKGGKHGKIVVAGNPEESDLIKRIGLSIDDQHHMPPKEKRQLSKQEIGWLITWVETGISFDKPLLALTSLEKVEHLLHSETGATADLPPGDVTVPDEAILEALMDKGISVSPVGQESNFLQVNFISASQQTSGLIPELKGVAENVVWLKLNDTNAGDDAMEFIKNLPNLTRLNIANTLVTDEGLKHLAALPLLYALNLRGTKVTVGGLRYLKSLNNLRYLYLYQTNVTPEEGTLLRQMFPSAEIDFGGYQVPSLATDTMVIKAK